MYGFAYVWKETIVLFGMMFLNVSQPPGNLASNESARITTEMPSMRTAIIQLFQWIVSKAGFRVLHSAQDQSIDECRRTSRQSEETYFQNFLKFLGDWICLANVTFGRPGPGPVGSPIFWGVWIAFTLAIKGTHTPPFCEFRVIPRGLGK